MLKISSPTWWAVGSAASTLAGTLEVSSGASAAAARSSTAAGRGWLMACLTSGSTCCSSPV
jgi:hypothetical protein